ncbi:multiple monosaccharide ABC transporter substrate-binding protein [Salininema proteolyticum]|uniref:Multiple monosaccharide ABC transporter substrate-binding protein n=1 Tax=Salininema proteolyticum TaxID=1607685 RepID=A0ABV8TYI0_9ACTN
MQDFSLKRRHLLAAGGAAALSAPLLTACASGDGGGKDKIGVSMPTQTSERWIADGDNVKAQLEEAGYDVILNFAADKVDRQINQIETMVSQGVVALVIAAKDGSTLGGVLGQAKEDDIPVIAYDRLITETEDVDYYVTFDNYNVGVLQGQYIVDALGLDDTDEAFNIELFAGSLDDNNAFFFWDGAIDTLKPYIDDGKLVVRSGQTEIEQAATESWLAENAQDRMDNILSTHYSSEKVDAVLAPFDGISRGIIASLESNGYTGEDLPVITGQDAELESVKAIIDGRQTQTVFKDTRELAKVAVSMVEDLLAGEDPEVNDTETYDNGKKVVESYLLEPVNVDASNWEELLVGSDYYTEDDFK